MKHMGILQTSFSLEFYDEYHYKAPSYLNGRVLAYLGGFILTL
jgi:hypothetical protein